MNVPLLTCLDTEILHDEKAKVTPGIVKNIIKNENLYSLL